MRGPPHGSHTAFANNIDQFVGANGVARIFQPFCFVGLVFAFFKVARLEFVIASGQLLDSCFKRIAGRLGLSDAEKADVFGGTAARVYRLPPLTP